MVQVQLTKPLDTTYADPQPGELLDELRDTLSQSGYFVEREGSDTEDLTVTLLNF